MNDKNEIHAPYKTPEDQLNVLNEAIYSILAGGQSYKIGSRSLTRADLGALVRERDRVQAQIANSGSSLLAGAVVADFGYDNRR